jgi:putative protease
MDPKTGGGLTMSEEQVGVVVKFFAKPSVAAIEVTGDSIKVGDTLKYLGHTTDFSEEATSIQVDNQAVDEAKKGDLIGIKVKDRVRENDKVYKVVE